jgi:hypothetical protein
MRQFRFLTILLLFFVTGRADTTQVSPGLIIDSVLTDSSGVVPDTTSGFPATAAPVVDSAEAKDTVLFEPVRVAGVRRWEMDPVDLEHHLNQNPTVALFKSMLVPGLGQIGNRSYIKAAIAIGLESWLFSRALHYRSETRERWERYESAEEVQLRNIYYAEYQDSRSQRNKYTWFTALTIFVSMFDAYVDAHLSGTPDRSHERGMDLAVVPGANGGAGVTLRLKF